MSARETVRTQLPLLLWEHNVRMLLDAPCGDSEWMRLIADEVDSYIGIDIVPDLISRNTLAYGTANIEFQVADMTSAPLPKGDLILCRDCLIHLPTRLIHRPLRNLRASGARYLPLTNNSNVQAYHDIAVGSFQPITFSPPPFRFPSPIISISEDSNVGREPCLWASKDPTIP